MEPLRLMIVDDDPPVRSSLVEFLEDFDYEVDSFENAEEALFAVEQGEIYDAAILDLRLPGMTGEDLLYKIHAITPSTRFIIHTGSVDFIISQQLQQTGFTEKQILRKPVANMDIFITTIAELFGQK